VKRGAVGTDIVIRRQGKDDLRVYIVTLHAAGAQVVDGTPTCGEHVSAGEQDIGVEEGILEGGIGVEQLLAEEGGVVHVGEEEDVQGVLRQMWEMDRLHDVTARRTGCVSNRKDVVDNRREEVVL
jgi:hypothetical protein